MQNRYTGDIGDFAKYGLLRALALAAKCRLGVAWYLYPDEPRKGDGRYTDYLNEPEKWRDLDPDLFDTLRAVVQSGQRDVRQIANSGLLSDAVFSGQLLAFEGDASTRAARRAEWFVGVLTELRDCPLVFADPDNGLCEDRSYAMSRKNHWKRMPLSEAHVMAAGRTGVIYHHNTRRPGGHAQEIQEWLAFLGNDTLALYWRGYSNRTFFIIHPTEQIRQRVESFAKDWHPHFELRTSLASDRVPNNKRAARNGQHETSGQACPECEHRFRGRGWGGIDAHWKKYHEHIMPYSSAWPIIQNGGKPSDSAKSE